jgi:hypothetical protein
MVAATSAGEREAGTASKDPAAKVLKSVFSPPM